MAKYGVCITLPKTKERFYLMDEAAKAWISGYEIDPNLCWNSDISAPGIAKFPTLNKAESVMLLTPTAHLSLAFPKVMRF